jgi:hypothetical protein
MGFAGGASKKRKRSGTGSSPAKKGSPSTGPAGLLPPLGRTGAAPVGEAWEALLRLPGETTKDKCNRLLADVYNPLHQRVYEEVKERKFRHLNMDSHMWGYITAAQKEDPRLGWIMSLGNIPPGMRRNTQGHVDPDDFFAWDWLREVVPGMRGLDNTAAVADATDPRYWGPELPGQSTGQQNISFGAKGSIVDANALRRHLKEVCHVTLSFLVTRIRDYVLRALGEIKRRRETLGLSSTAVSSIPPRHPRTELSGTPPHMLLARPVGMEQFVPPGTHLDYGPGPAPARTSDARATGVAPLIGGAQDAAPSTTTSSVVEALLLDNFVEDFDMPPRDEGKGQDPERTPPE